MKAHNTKRALDSRTAARKNEIAAAGLGLVEERGYAAVSASALSAQSGISESTINYQFPTRAHLLVSILEYGDRKHAEDLIGKFDQNAIITPSDVIFDIAEGDVGHLETLKLFHYLLGEAVDNSHPAHTYIAARHKSTVELLAGLVRARQASGHAHPDLDPEITARQILASWIGLEALWLLDPSFDFADSVKRVVRQLTRQDAMEAKQAMEQLAATF